MKRLALMVIAALVASLVAAPPASARKRFPKHLDAKSWEVPEDMSWGDYKPIPGVDWKDPANQPIKKLRAALILGDFQDQKFRVQETTVDPTGQRGLGVKDPAQWWLDFLFVDDEPTALNHGHHVGEYWLEDSYGIVGVEAQAFGPYTMEGNMYEYGVTDFGSGEDCPDGPEGCSGDFDSEVTAASAPDVTLSQSMFGEFDFRFLLHAGYDESGVWLNYGIDKFAKKEDVTDAYGPANPEHRNWSTTRYVDWTSFFAGQQIWSHALPGALSTQGESDGGSTYAHELSHILGVLDNYNNPYAEEPKRAYSGPWDMMSRGTFNGPGGPWERNLIPPVKGGTMGSHHMIRNKLRMGFLPASEVLTLDRSALDATGIATATIQQRESPPDTADAAIFSGMRIVLGEDAEDCDNAEPKCDGGGYDFYDVEVVNRQGFDSFLPDHGVLIAKTKVADASPFIWVIDAHPKDLQLTDYTAADGTKVPYTVGDYRQLADAAFHAGTAPGTSNSFVDEKNGLAFYVIEKHRLVEGLLGYTVAIRSTSVAPPEDAAEVTTVGGRLTRKITAQRFEVTNVSDGQAVFELKVAKKGKVKTRLLNDLLLLDAGETKEVIVWAKKGRGRGKVTLSAKAV
jgi:M6 family metalloprotease-like protein